MSARTPFALLFREFFGQFFASESVTSDLQLRRALIAVLAFLITPGLMLSTMIYPAYEFARFRNPELIQPLTRMLAGLFLTYSIMTTGFVGAIAWDSLSFDRRDVMVLGPLPVTRLVVVRAKLAALGALLLGTSLSMNIMTAVLFAMAANGPKDTALSLLRHIGAHLFATTCAALFIFSAIVILRALVSMLARGHAGTALGSFLQFAFVAALLCFFVLAPTSTSIDSIGRGRATLRLSTLPRWLPSGFFLPLYEQLRGTGDPWMTEAARRTVLTTIALAGSAAFLTVAAYRRQLQSALSPAATAGALGGAHVSRAAARALSGSNLIARATADFVLTSVARNRSQQAPIAINAAIGLALVVAKLAPEEHGVSPVLQNPSLVLAIPLMLTYWAAIGLRAAFFIPVELKGAWTFRVNAPAAVSGYALGTRAAIVGFTMPAALPGALATGWWAGGRSGAILHGAFVVLLTVALANVLTLTVGNIPFTGAYLPGHARLRTRWPFYLFGALLFGDRLAALEMRLWNQLDRFAILLAFIAMVIVVLEWAVRKQGRRWRVEPDADGDHDESEVTVLGLGYVRPAATQA